jgi:hypothetical protein
MRPARRPGRVQHREPGVRRPDQHPTVRQWPQAHEGVGAGSQLTPGARPGRGPRHNGPRVCVPIASAGIKHGAVGRPGNGRESAVIDPAHLRAGQRGEGVPVDERDCWCLVIADGEPVARGGEGEARRCSAVYGLRHRHAPEGAIVEAQGPVPARGGQPPVGGEGRAVTGAAIRRIAHHLPPAGIAVIDAQAARAPQRCCQVAPRGRKDQVQDDVGQALETPHERPGITVEEVNMR